MSRNAKATYCRACGAAVWVGVDADTAGIPVTIDREPMRDAAKIADAWPEIYVIRMRRIYAVFYPRRIDFAWETVHRTHNCEGE